VPRSQGKVPEFYGRRSSHSTEESSIIMICCCSLRMYSMYGVCACIHVDWYVCGNLRGPPSDKGGDGDKGRRREAQRGLDITGIFFSYECCSKSIGSCGLHEMLLPLTLKLECVPTLTNL